MEKTKEHTNIGAPEVVGGVSAGAIAGGVAYVGLEAKKAAQYGGIFLNKKGEEIVNLAEEGARNAGIIDPNKIKAIGEEALHKAASLGTKEKCIAGAAAITAAFLAGYGIHKIREHQQAKHQKPTDSPSNQIEGSTVSVQKMQEQSVAAGQGRG